MQYFTTLLPPWSVYTMFATLRNREHQKTLKALIIHDTDPHSPGSFPYCDTLPDAVRLQRDREWYKRTQSLPQVTFIGPCTLDTKPVVFVGGLLVSQGQVTIQSNVGSWTVDLNSFQTENNELSSHLVQGIPTKGPVLTGSSKNSVRIEWVSLNSAQKHGSKHSCLGWIAGLALQHNTTTSILLLQRSDTVGHVASVSDIGISDTIWMWYPPGKPRNLKKWLHFLWGEDLSEEEESQIWGHIHPMHAGFYLIKPSQGKTPNLCRISFCVSPLANIEARVVQRQGRKILEAVAEVELASRCDQHIRLSDWGFNGTSMSPFPVYLLPRTAPISQIGPIRSGHLDPTTWTTWTQSNQRITPCYESLRKLLFSISKGNEHNLASLLIVQVDEDSDDDFMQVTKKVRHSNDRK